MVLDVVLNHFLLNLTWKLAKIVVLKKTKVVFYPKSTRGQCCTIVLEILWATKLSNIHLTLSSYQQPDFALIHLCFCFLLPYMGDILGTKWFWVLFHHILFHSVNSVSNVFSNLKFLGTRQDWRPCNSLHGRLKSWLIPVIHFKYKISSQNSLTGISIVCFMSKITPIKRFVLAYCWKR